MGINRWRDGKKKNMKIQQVPNVMCNYIKEKVLDELNSRLGMREEKVGELEITLVEII